tara:strand:+ start:120 stop:476 length:357 start_codon:yes stop_codon:yes gene_type:complete
MPKLKEIDICANKITDYGLSIFFKSFVSGHQFLESFKISLNKIKENATGEVIKDAIEACPKLKAMSFKRCDMPPGCYKAIIPGLRINTEFLELDRNNINNEMFKLMKTHINVNMFGRS